MKKPKILFLDIESSLMLISAFDLKPKWHGHDSIVQDWNIICAAWKWLGEKKTHAVCVSSRDMTNDFNVVKKLHSLIEKADIVVGHNSDRFDIKKINTRCLYHGLTPLKQVQTVDTLKVARKCFHLTSNRLDYIAKYLNVGGKTDNTRGLWQRIVLGDKKALKEMVVYNKNDVVIQEKVYLEIRGYAKNHPNMNVILGTEKLVCTNCGSSSIVRNGYKNTRTGRYQRYQCKDCGCSFRGRTALQTFDGR